MSTGRSLDCASNGGSARGFFLPDYIRCSASYTFEQCRFWTRLPDSSCSFRSCSHFDVLQLILVVDIIDLIHQSVGVGKSVTCERVEAMSFHLPEMIY